MREITTLPRSKSSQHQKRFCQIARVEIYLRMDRAAAPALKLH